MLFNVTYEIVTPESAENGDASERGFAAEGVSLRDAIESLFATRTSRVDGIETIESNSRWVTVYNGAEYETGARESRSLHIPAKVTTASRDRIFRLVQL